MRLEIIELEQGDQRRALDDERVDMCFVRLPIRDEQLHLIPLYDEVPVVIASKDHPVSAFDEVSLADLSEENELDPNDTLGAIDLVAAGAGVLLVPHSIARSHSRRDLVYRPVSDGTPTHIALAWLVENPNALIEEFIGVVRGRTPNSSRTPRKGEKTLSPTQNEGRQNEAPRKRGASRKPRRR